MAKKRSRSAEPATRYRREQLAKRAAVPESMIATVVAPQAQSPLPLATPPAPSEDE